MYLHKFHKYLSFPLFADLGRHHVHEKIQKQQTYNDRECRQYIIECSEGKHLFSQADDIYPIINALETSLANYQSPMLSYNL